MTILEKITMFLIMLVCMMLMTISWRLENSITEHQEMISIQTELLAAHGRTIKMNSGSIETNAVSINMGTKIMDSQHRTIKNLHGLK